MKKLSINSIVLFTVTISLLFDLCFTTVAKAQTADTAAVIKKQPYKLLYYVSNDDGKDELCTANSDGTNVHRIHIKNLPPDEMMEFYSLAISPDHKTIFFTSSVIKHGKKLLQPYACNIDGSNLHPLFVGNVVRIAAYAPVTDIMESPSYKLLYAVDYDQNIGDKLYTANYNGTSRHRIHINLPKGEHLEDNFLAVSPDHKTIFFTSFRWKDGECFSQPYTCNIDGSNLHPILRGNVMGLVAYGAAVTETPLYKLVYFDIGDDGGDDNLYTANSDGTNRHRIHINLSWYIDMYDYFLAVSPDYKTIFFSAIDLRQEKLEALLYACNIDGSNLHPILGSSYGDILRLAVY